MEPSMKPGIPATRVSNHYQIAYVTTDIDRAVEIFRKDYGVPSVLVWKDVTINVTTPRGTGPFTLHAGFVWVNETMYELIQPVGGLVDLYWDYLPKEGFAMVFHHFAFEVVGEREDWLKFRETLGANRTFAIEGDPDFPVQFVYTDERDRLGHYHEYIWMGPGADEAFADVPRY